LLWFVCGWLLFFRHICDIKNTNYFHDFHKDKNAIVLGISLDGQDKKSDAEKFINRHFVSFDNLIGEVEAVASIYTDLTGQAWIGTPTFLVYAPDGKLMAQQVGAVPTDLLEKFITKHADKYGSVSTKTGSSK